MPVSQTMTLPSLRAMRQTQAQSIMLLPSAGFCLSHRTFGTTPNIRPPSAFHRSAIRRWSSRSPSCTSPYMLVEMPAPAIRTSQLTKDYGAGRGLFNLDLQVSAQEVIGYLGPNGAGKTTTIRLLMGMIRPTAGSAYVFGLDCVRDSVAVKRKVGYLPGDVPQFGSLTGSEVVAYLGGMRGGVDRMRVRRIAERFELDLSRRFREYSSGNKQKLAVLLAFMHRPELLILDEPTASLDPLNQQEFYALLREARDDGASVFLSSHILSEVERVCDRVGIVRDGRLVRFSLAAFVSVFIQTVGFYQIAGHTLIARAAFGASMAALASQFVALFPAPVRPDTVGGYVEFRGIHPLAILFAAWALVAATGFARGDEDRGIVETTLATGVSRPALVATRTAAFALGLTIASLAAAAGFLLGVASGGETPQLRGILEDAALLAAVGLACYGIALLIAQLAPGRAATTAAGAVLLALFLLNSLSRVYGSLAGWRWLSPFRYYDLSQPLPPGGTFDARALAVLVAIGAGTAAGAAVAVRFRDVGGTLVRIPFPARRPSWDVTAPPWWSVPVVRGLWQRRAGISAWSVGLALVAVVFVNLTRTIVN